jgi:phage internal scaffolding protein
MFIRSNYNYNTKKATKANSIACAEPTLTQQNFKDSTDINRIVKQYGKTGLAEQTTRQPLPEDYHNITDYHSAMNAIRAGDEAFAELPATTRERFDNDPAKFVDFCLDEKNNEEATQMGLAFRKITPEITPTPEALEPEAQ